MRAPYLKGYGLFIIEVSYEAFATEPFCPAFCLVRFAEYFLYGTIKVSSRVFAGRTLFGSMKNIFLGCTKKQNHEEIYSQVTYTD